MKQRSARSRRIPFQHRSATTLVRWFGAAGARLSSIDEPLPIPDFEAVEPGGPRGEQHLSLPDQIIVGAGKERRQALDPGTSQK
jgi:hypothetical protein